MVLTSGFAQGRLLPEGPRPIGNRFAPSKQATKPRSTEPLVPEILGRPCPWLPGCAVSTGNCTGEGAAFRTVRRRPNTGFGTALPKLTNGLFYFPPKASVESTPHGCYRYQSSRPRRTASALSL